MDTPSAAGAPITGADVDALLASALALATTADLLELVDLRTYDGLAALAWDGPDARRMREEWDREHAVTLHLGAEALRAAADRLVREADEQEAASAVTGSEAGSTVPTSGTGPGSGAPGTAPGSPPSRWDHLRERLADAARTTVEAGTEAIRQVSALGDAVDSAGLAGLRVRAAQALADGGLLARVTELSIGPVTDRALGAVGAVGVVVSGYDTGVALREGDWWGVTDGSVSTVLGSAAMTGNPAAIAAAGAWTGGAIIGGQINEAMEGTSYGGHFERRMEAAFDTVGAAGMLWTPVALAQAGIDSAVEGARELAADAAEAYRRIDAATSSPTPWGMQTLSAPWPDDSEPGEP